MYFPPHVFHTSYFTYFTVFRNVSYYPITESCTSYYSYYVLLIRSCGAYVIIIFLDSKPPQKIEYSYFPWHVFRTSCFTCFVLPNVVLKKCLRKIATTFSCGVNFWSTSFQNVQHNHAHLFQLPVFDRIQQLKKSASKSRAFAINVLLTILCALKISWSPIRLMNWVIFVILEL